MLALSIPALEDRKNRIFRLLADLGDMRPGSLSGRSHPGRETRPQGVRGKHPARLLGQWDALSRYSFRLVRGTRLHP